MIRKLKKHSYRFLKWSENYTKTDMTYLSKGGFWLVSGTIFSTAIKFGSVIAFANLLDPSTYGTYQFILSIAAIIGAFTLTGMPPAVAQAVARGYKGALKRGAWINLKWSIGIVIAAGAVAIYYFINDNYTIAIGILLVGAFAPFIESTRLYESFLTGSKEFKAVFLFSIPRKIVPFVVMVTLLFLTENPTILIFGYYASNTIVMSLAYFLTIHKYKPTGETDSETIVFSKHLSIMGVLTQVAANLDRILIFHYLGAVELAIYAFAQTGPKQIKALMNPLHTLAFPKFSSQPIHVLKQSLPRKLVLLFFFLLTIVIAYILAAPFIFHLIFPQYLDSIFFSQVISLTLLFMPLAFLKQTFQAHMKKRELYILNVGGQVTKIILLIILLPLIGIWGAIATTFITQTLTGGGAVYLFARAR